MATKLRKEETPVDFEGMAQDKPDALTLEQLTERCTYLELLSQKAEEITDKLKTINDEINGITTQELPEQFMMMGLSELKLTSGRKISLLPFYSAKIPEENKVAAFKWLEQHDHDGIIKASVEMTFGKGEEEKKQEKKVVAALEKIGVLFSHDRKIHPMTLKAFVKEMMESGTEFPTDLFGAYAGKVVKIK